jgi:hypothetical protein
LWRVASGGSTGAGANRTKNAEKEGKTAQKTPQNGGWHFSRSNVFNYLRNATGRFSRLPMSSNHNLFSYLSRVDGWKKLKTCGDSRVTARWSPGLSSLETDTPSPHITKGLALYAKAGVASSYLLIV